MSETKSTPSLESTLKSLDTEEFIDIHFYRPIGYQWALFFNKLGVSPNSITIASIFIGIAAGICFYFQSLAINVIGMLLWGIWIWLLAATTGFFHSKQAAMADYYRNIHLLFLKGKSGSELSHSPLLKENYKKMSWKHDFIYKLFETFYINYTVGQEAWTPKFQHMMNIIREKYNGQAPEWFRKA